MERLKIHRENLIKALATLNQILSNKFIFEDDIELSKAIRDSKIQRFEYCVDLFWKYLSRYLLVYHGQIINTPKPVIKEVYKTGLITEEETQELLDMIDWRNKTSHIYLEMIADSLAKEIPKYYELMSFVFDKTNKK